jgi:drug/metabolite transporter (DMT)-like permease
VHALSGRVVAALLTVYVVWGSTYLAMKWAVAELPALPSGTIRFLLAGAVFLVAGHLRGGGAPLTRRQVASAALVGAFMPGLCNGLVFVAQKTVASSLAAILLAVMPLWVALMEAVRPGGARPGGRAIAGLLVGFGGTALLVLRPGAGLVADGAGVALLLVSAFVWAAFSIYARHADRPSSWLTSAGLEMVTGGLAQGLVALARGDFADLVAARPSARAVLAVAYLVAVGSWLGYGAFSWLLRHASPALVSTYAYVNPLVAVALGALLGGEGLDARTAVSGALIVSAVVLVTTARRP